MANARTRVLWVSFDFPPRQSSAVFRPIKIYKYLDKNAYEVDFLTQSLSGKHEQAIMDETLMREVSPTPRVHKVANWVLHDLILDAARRRKRAPSGATGERDRGTAPAIDASPRNGRRSGVAKKVYAGLAMLVYFPDQFFLWGWLTAVRALALHLTRRYDVVYTTSYPESGHLAGLMLKSFGVKWVADYRYGGPLWIRKLVGFRKPPWREKRDARFQKRVLRKADVVVTQSDSIRMDFARVFELDPGKLRTIPSGYDESDFAVSRKAPFEKRDGELHVIHAGAAYLDDAQRTRMIEVLEVLASGLADEGYRLVLHALGDDLLRAASPNREIGFDYRFHGVVPHPELPAFLSGADWYLLSTLTASAESGLVNGYLPSKMWEYLRGGKPIVLFGERDEVWRIVDEAGAGIYLGSLDNGNCPDAVRVLDATRSLTASPSRIAKHSWRSRAGAMQRVFSDLSDPGGQKLEVPRS